MNSIGKAARKKFGNRHAAKAAKRRKVRRKVFGHLTYSIIRKTAEAFVREHGGEGPGDEITTDQPSRREI